jgi:hypothetical protein
MTVEEMYQRLKELRREGFGPYTVFDLTATRTISEVTTNGRPGHKWISFEIGDVYR